MEKNGWQSEAYGLSLSGSWAHGPFPMRQLSRLISALPIRKWNIGWDRKHSS
ncbi:hypothetical protein PICMEDRAFT_14478 [Pichia membranifaciens NRRL Y-2026]|uniref:Uncharacterized protein n=1 Tax=Pichia membranifaciens NRRL Y-2026 TaxID=763406 RepID=A0A1E3NS98_9ASCO|nr:hypothetical protein PICMEDRAFT_14478 [Pichia membranifaciens NRRL Y-2026]ODQ48971.1 hypothetical protein PICMEDRAFT_14478 [Pichia membranifaciens NRRL Y-2026]